MELSELIGEDFSAGELLERLSRAGLQLTPCVDAQSVLTSSAEDEKEDEGRKHEGRGAGAKTQALERHFAEEVACIASAFDVYGGAKNRQLGASRSIFNIRESSAFTGMNKETLGPISILLEEDAASDSVNLAPHLGVLTSPGLKFTGG